MKPSGSQPTSSRDGGDKSASSTARQPAEKLLIKKVKENQKLTEKPDEGSKKKQNTNKVETVFDSSQKPKDTLENYISMTEVRELIQLNNSRYNEILPKMQNEIKSFTKQIRDMDRENKSMQSRLSQVSEWVNELGNDGKKVESLMGTVKLNHMKVQDKWQEQKIIDESLSEEIKETNERFTEVHTMIEAKDE